MRGKIAKQLRKGSRKEGRVEVAYNNWAPPKFAKITTAIDGQLIFDGDESTDNHTTHYRKVANGVPCQLTDSNRKSYQESKKLYKS